MDRTVDNHKLIDIVHKCSYKGFPLEGVYRRIQDRELFLIAYGNLYSNDGATTPGVNPEDSADGMSLKRIDGMLEKLNQNNYQWTPVRREYIEKKSGGQRPLGITGWDDKLMQEVIRLVLEAYYEPQFSEDSHGYRPSRGCHTALQDIKHGWTGTKWFIEGDIKGCFDHIDHDTLLGILARHIKDNRFLKLIRTMLKAGYIEDWKYHATYSGAPQGGVVSPILSNILLNELDQYVANELMPEYNRGDRRSNNEEYNRLWRDMRRAWRAGDRDGYKELKRQRSRLPRLDPEDPDYRRLHYNRYADDFLYGFAGPKWEAEEIRERTDEVLKTLKLDMSEEKTLITHAATGKARYLGYDSTVVTSKNRRKANYNIKFLVPPDVKTEWLRKYTKHGKPCVRARLLEMTDYEIVAYYASEFQGGVNYYTMTEDVSQVFHHIKYVAVQSAVKTLASKHKTSARKIYRKYYRNSDQGRKALIVEVPNPKNPKKPFIAQLGGRPIEHKRKVILKDQKWVPHYARNELITRLLADTCELCGRHDNVQVHHVRKLADLKQRYKGRKKPPPWVEFMLARRRKTVVVCEQCHLDIHIGKYDGRKVNQG